MTAPHLVGRAAQLRVLIDLVERAGEQGGALAVLGEPGIGKSSLLRAAAEHGRAAGLWVLETTGVQAETGFPFAGLHQVLRPVLGGAGGLPASQRHALLTALGVEDGPPPEPYLIALAALSLLTDVATERPVLVVVDDVQWLDPPSHDALAFIARRVSRDPIVIIGALRQGHAGPFVESGLPELDVPGLDEVSARAVLSGIAAGLSLADREQILRDARGNPLALVELPAELRASPELGVGPLPLTDRLERTFAGRIADLPGPTRDAVLVAAVNSTDELPEILAAASVLASRPVGVDALDVAAAAGLLGFDERKVRFRHPLVRSGVLQSESVARRQAAHAALADVLAGEPYRRVLHRAQSIVGPDDEVADELADSHRVALRRGSVTSAIWALERSAQLTTDSAKRGRRLLLAAEHAFGLGRSDLVDRLVTAASRTDLSYLDKARMEWLREIFNDGVPGDAARVQELCAIAGKSHAAGDTDLALNLLLGAALRCWWADTGPAARQRVATVTELTGAGADPRYAAALAVAEPVLCGEVALDLLSGVMIERVTDADALRLLGMAAHAIGDPVRAVDFLDRSETKLREQGRLGLLSHVLTMQVLDRLELGDWERAAAALEEGGRLAQDTGQPIWGNVSLVDTAINAGLRGDNDRAQALATQAERDASGRNLNCLLACVQLARGYGWISTGHHAEAYQALRPLFDPDAASFHLTERFHAVMYLTEAAVHIGKRDDARAVLADLERVAAVTPSATLRVHLSYARAVLADDEHAEDLFHAALAQNLIRWPWAKARIELAYGTWLRRQRRVAESRIPLRAAQTVLDLIGATAWADAARAELKSPRSLEESRDSPLR